MCEPIVGGGLWGSLGGAPQRLATVFTAPPVRSRAPAHAGQARSAKYGIRGPCASATSCATRPHPEVVVDGERREVRIDGRAVSLPPARELPLNRAYFLV